MTNEFMDVARIIESLRDLGYTVLRDTTVRETDELPGCGRDTVVDMTVILPDDNESEEEDGDIREVVRDELSRCLEPGHIGEVR